ncbi:hypothetical protein BED47_00805 [Gottfriedia luciferensis]|uniref:Uncharacterized protein n=1 Tax=Gottfriedia luciferensis TaxID=178774 RepID=A0ABX2ZVJ3_9BACI|nr:hypothetical protein [Gottfriedia luciferensis]ODG93741.1 hypothetical protein BED47_00805 [Gottfriedia luciferensis]
MVRTVWVHVVNDEICGYSDSFVQDWIEYEAEEDFRACPFRYSYFEESFVLNEVQDRIISNRNISKEYQTFLDETDWKIVRHRDQLELGIETNLTNEEFIELLRARQEAREKIVNK